MTCLDRFLEVFVGSTKPINRGQFGDDGDEDGQMMERKMQPARGRFPRSDLDRQMASTFPCPLKSGPSSRFWGQPATGTRRVAGTTHTESGRR